MPQRTHKDLSQLTQTGETQVTGLLESVKDQEATSPDDPRRAYPPQPGPA